MLSIGELNMINELLHDIAELEEVVESIKRVNKPETVVAIRTIDLMIERKQAQVEAFERTAYEN